MYHLNLLGLPLWLLVSVFLPLAQAQASDTAVAEDEPVVHFRFEAGLANTGSLGDEISAKQQGKVTLGQAGPRPKPYPDFSAVICESPIRVKPVRLISPTATR